mmetsp:Transcript_17678/g.30501  ORF Transcript_17678/g.30501 Transcript_17678/m.30501 type:complete len:89 (+) Transcript_17678:229-495(+)
MTLCSSAMGHRSLISTLRKFVMHGVRAAPGEASPFNSATEMGSSQTWCKQSQQVSWKWLLQHVFWAFAVLLVSLPVASSGQEAETAAC